MKCLNLSLLIMILATPLVLAQSSADPNSPYTELTFENSRLELEWIVPSQRTREEGALLYSNPDSHVPPYVAALMLHVKSPRLRGEAAIAHKIKANPLANEFSERQQALLELGYAVWVDYDAKHLPDDFKALPDYYPTWFYATSEADARNMVLAYLDALNRDVSAEIVEFKRAIQELEQELQQAQQDLPQKTSERDQVQADLRRIRDIRHKAVEHAEEKANQTITEMRDTLDKLEIEFKGLDAKLKVVEEFRSQKRGQALSPQVQLRLDEMHMELMIEISGLEARKTTAERILTQESEFLDLSNRQNTLQRAVTNLRRRVSERQRRIADMNNAIENPGRSNLPPKVYKDWVQIYRVKGSTTPQDVEEYLRGYENKLQSRYTRPSVGDDWIWQMDQFLQMEDEGYFRLESSVADQIAGLKERIQTKQVESLLMGIPNQRKQLLGLLYRFDRNLASRLSGKLDEYEASAKNYLALVEEGSLLLEGSTVQRLKGIKEELAVEVVEAFIQKVESIVLDIESSIYKEVPASRLSGINSLRKHRSFLQFNLPRFSDIVNEDKLQLDAPLAERLNRIVQKVDELYKANFLEND
ncbi:hypothetical protein ACFL6U_10755 [Planctomycetota bacterium]